MRILFFLLLFLPWTSFGQYLEVPQKRCATVEVLENQRRLHQNLETDEQFESWLRQKVQARLHGVQSVRVLPVVFHIIHNGEGEGTGTNLSQATIQQQLLQLNKDFANLSNSPYAVSVNTNIQFGLAQVDPNGVALAQPGIDRVNRNTAGFTAPPYTVGYASAASNYLNSTIKPATIWDPNRYVNIWVLEMESGVLGIATFPGSSGLLGLNNLETNTTAGVAVGPTTLGSMFSPTGCGAYTKGKTLTHEVGHFLGLRHIWGDATCGTDYCDDTPVHQAANSGVPTHPKSNTCGTADEMFENYMDYCNDDALNTFTAGQLLRMEAVMANSPRRVGLLTSNVPVATLTGYNRIGFADCTGFATYSEAGVSGTYPRYRELQLTLVVEDKASSNAILNITGSGTAVSGLHYQLMTPTLSFAAGETSKTIVVRLLDNALAETDRTLTLGYTISGSGVQAGTSYQTFTLNITDDDNLTVSNGTVTLLNESFEGALTGWSSLTSAGAVNKFAVSSNADPGTGNAAHISSSTVAPFAYTYNKTATSLAVLRTPLIDARGVFNLQLSFKYKCRGEVSGGTAFDYGGIRYATSTAPNTFSTTGATGAGPYASNGTTTASPTITLPNTTFANKQFYLGLWWQNDDSGGNDPPVSYDDVVLTGTGTQVENTVSSGYSFDVQAGTGINNFRSVNEKAIARITNASAVVNGLTPSITAAGNGQVAITSGGNSYMRTQKVIKLTPGVANSTVTYQVTLYYTSAELSVWGVNRTSLKILKINDGVSLSGPVNSSNATLINPTSVAEDVAGGVISYTANCTGFSQFVLVSANFILPVNLVQFEARPAGRTVALSWRTASEINNKGFQVERSTNGTDFSSIGWVDGNGTTQSPISYTYTDRYVQPGQLYHYRLKQVDHDLTPHYSAIRQVRLSEAALVLKVSPNPARDLLSVFLSGTRELADISLINSGGQVTGRWANTDAAATPFAIDVRHLPRGHYTVRVSVGGEVLSSIVVLQ